MDSVVATLLKAGPAYLLAAVLLAILVWLARTWRTDTKARDAKIDALADKLYDVALQGVRRDTEVISTLESVRRDINEVRRSGYCYHRRDDDR